MSETPDPNRDGANRQRTSRPGASRYGETALRLGPLEQPQAIAQQLVSPRPQGILDVVAGHTTVLVHFDPQQTNALAVREWIDQALAKVQPGRSTPARTVTLPVLYEGADLAALAEHAKLSVPEVIALHAAGSYQVRIVGFAPGFAYLDGLDPRLAMPRRATPRTQVPAGSIAIGAGQTGLYALASPGGWNLIGQTPLTGFDPQRDPASLLQVGDRVSFEPIDRATFERVAAEQHVRPPHEPLGTPLFEVVEPGLQTTLQDLGRWGHQAVGVTPGGVADRDAALVANLLVGNDLSAPLLEATLIGPTLRALTDSVVALAGATVAGPTVAGRSMGRPFLLPAGETLDLRQLASGARLYLAVRGGFTAENVLGSAGTDLRAGLGGHTGRGEALARGDLLYGSRGVDLSIDWPANQSIDPRQLIPQQGVANQMASAIRLLPGPDAALLADDSSALLTSQTYHVRSDSDRMGLRLVGEQQLKRTCEADTLLSEPVVTGAVQLPPSGDPIVLLADRQTVGGYPVVGCVASVDLPRLAQLRPGASLRFQWIDHDEADRLHAARHRALAFMRQSLKLQGR